MSGGRDPRVRIVVVNYDGGDLLLECLRSLGELDWPLEQLDVVVVDNGSTDGSAERARQRFPGVRVLETGRNLGFAAGNNFALADLDGCDYVALLNNDATVEAGWLRALVAVLEEDSNVGAACPKILFASRFAEVSLAAPGSRLGRGDLRSLGVRLSGARVGESDRWREVQFVDGWYPWELGIQGEPVRWSRPSALLRLPRGEAKVERAALCLAADRPKTVQVETGRKRASARLGKEPVWVELPLVSLGVDVVNNAGSVALAGGYGADRGYLDVDEGQYDSPAEVFAWCGCSVLLRSAYLADVGLFDPSLFLYYEDFDLSWRGRAGGWRYVYTPDAVVRHVHTAGSLEGSRRFQHYVERNRLLVHAKNAPAAYAAHAVVRYLGGTAWSGVRDVASPLLRGERPNPRIVARRLGTFGSFLRLLPAVLRERRRLRRGRQVPDADLVAWVVRRT